MRKKIFSMLIVLSMIVGILPTTVFAENSSSTKTYTSVLEFTDITEDVVAEDDLGYTWDLARKTLTITEDLEMNITFPWDASAITLPANATMVLNGDLTISSTYYSILVNDSENSNLTILGDGKLTSTVSRTGIYVANGNIEFNNIDADFTTSTYGIYTNNGDIIIKNSNFNVGGSSSNSGIFALGDVTITDSTVENTSTSIAGESITINGSSKVTTPSINSEYGSVIIEDEAEVTSSYISTSFSNVIIFDYATFTGNISVSPVGYTASIDKTTTVTGVVSVLLDDETYLFSDTVYGDIVDTKGYLFYQGELAFAEGSSLTIDKNVSTDLSAYSIDWENCNIINNGTLVLPADTIFDEISSYITNNNVISIDGKIYDSNGEEVETIFKGTLELETDVEFNGAIYGFQWNEVQSVLTVNSTGLTIIPSEDSDDGLVVPAGTVIILNGDLDITSNGNGIASPNGLVISGRMANLNLNINAYDYGIISEDGSITIENIENINISAKTETAIYAEKSDIIVYGTSTNASTLTLNAYETGINAYKEIVIIGVSTVDITAENYGIYSENGTMTIICSNLNVLSNNTGIYAQFYGSDIENPSMAININAMNTTIKSYSDSCIVSDFCNIYLNISKTANLIAADASDSYGVYSHSGTLSLNGYGTLTSNAPIVSKDTISISSNLKINGFVLVEDDATFYGDVTITASNCKNFAINGNITFAENSSLTINETAVLNFYIPTINWDTSSIVNNGIIVLNGTYYVQEDISSLGITGDGYIIIVDGANEVVYKNDGTLVNSIVDNIELTETEITDGLETTYTWIKDGATGVYTLTFLEETIAVGSIKINAELDAIFNMTNKVTVFDEVVATGDLTISGTENLTINSTIKMYDGNLTVDCGKLTVKTIRTYDNSYDHKLTINSHLVVNTGSVWMGDIVLNGSVEAKNFVGTNLTVNNGGSLEVIEGSFYLMNNTEPKLTLDNKVGFLTPENGGYVVYSLEEDRETIYYGAVTTDGQEPNETYSNRARSIIIGEIEVEDDNLEDDEDNNNNNNNSSSNSSSVYYDIKLIISGKGTISPDGGNSSTVYLKKYSSLTFNFTADNGYEIEDVLVDNKSVGIVNDYKFSSLTSDHTLEVIFAEKGVTNTDIEEKEEDTDIKEDVKENPFEDVKSSDWFYDYVITAYENGWVSGISHTTYGPYETTSRAMLVTILSRMEDASADLEILSFKDVLATDWYAVGVIWAKENGIVNGYDEETFAPNEPVTREQMATILYGYAKFKGYDVSKTTSLSTFVDSDNVSSWALEAMSWAVANNIFTGREDNTLDPKNGATRAELAVVLGKFSEL